MADPKLPHVVVDKFAQYDPSEEDVRSVMSALQNLVQHPEEGTPVPFESAKLADCYIAWTDDKKWRILYRYRTPGQPEFLSIEPEEL